MKTFTCKELGGACDKKFSADTFDQMAEMSKAHGTEMYMAGDEAHLKAMAAMQDLMKEPAKLQAWFDGKRKEFEARKED